MTRLADLKVKIFADGADRAGMLELYRNPLIKGFTTNPTLMRNAGITDYEAFARDILKAIPDRPISLEVFSDDFAEMEAQARRIASWGENVYVKIPVTNTQGESAIPLIRTLAKAGVKQNVTALMTLAQVRDVSAALAAGPAACISVFAGRVADTGPRPRPDDGRGGRRCWRFTLNIELIWASPARAAQHLPRRPGRLPHHHRDARPAQEALTVRQGPRRVLARHREDVPQRRGQGGFPALMSGWEQTSCRDRRSFRSSCRSTTPSAMWPRQLKAFWGRLTGILSF